MRTWLLRGTWRHSALEDKEYQPESVERPATEEEVLFDFPTRQRQDSLSKSLLWLIRDRSDPRSGDKAIVYHALPSDHSPWTRSERRRPNAAGFVVRFAIGLVGTLLIVFGCLHILEVVVGGAREFLDLELYQQYHPRWEEPRPGSEAWSDLTRDVVPIPCHSHNDYWRRVPLFDAIRVGCNSIEADVWLFNDELYVGHTAASLRHNLTFDSLYINPLVNLLDAMNSVDSAFNATHQQSATPQGVFHSAPSQTLVLLVDFKTAGPLTFPVVQAQLDPLRRKDYLSYWDGQTFHSRAVTVVGTGTTPFHSIIANAAYHDIFFDAPLATLWEEEIGETLAGDSSLLQSSQHESEIEGDFNPTNSYYASASLMQAVGFVWPNGLSASQLDLVRGQVRGARRRGLRPRYWDTPAWPRALRNEVWRVLVEEGVAVLNVDDLAGAAREDWKRRRYGWWL